MLKYDNVNQPSLRMVWAEMLSSPNSGFAFLSASLYMPANAQKTIPTPDPKAETSSWPTATSNGARSIRRQRSRHRPFRQLDDVDYTVLHLHAVIDRELEYPELTLTCARTKSGRATQAYRIGFL